MVLSKLLERVFGFFSGPNWRTWLGHGLQGLVFGFALGWSAPVAISFTLGAFLHREVSDFVSPVFEGRLTWAQSLQKVREDGLLDLATPYMGLVLGLILHAITFGR